MEKIQVLYTATSPSGVSLIKKVFLPLSLLPKLMILLELELTLEDKMLEGEALGLEVYALLSNHIAGLRET